MTIEIEELSDSDIEGVAGGTAPSLCCCSTTSGPNSCSGTTPPPLDTL